MKKIVFIVGVILVSLVMTRCTGKGNNSSGTLATLSDDSLLTLVQYRTFQYFWDGAEPNSGMARERYHIGGIYPMNDKHIVTSGGSGFGLMAIIVAIERNFITRKEALTRFEKIIGFLESADRFHGAWPHWMNGETGKVKPFSLKDDGGDIVETAYLAQGLVCVKAYMDLSVEREAEIAKRIDDLWRGIEWSWYQNRQQILFWHWSPNYSWEMNFGIKGYNECLIAYILGASSPTYPITPEAYHKGWARDGGIVNSNPVAGAEELVLTHNSAPLGGPLFWAHYSYIGLDPQGLVDRYADYWKLNRAHVKANRQYCIDNPGKFKGYGEKSWGLTSSYSIQNYKLLFQNRDSIVEFGKDPLVAYASHKPLKDFSVISPTASLSSFPYMPEESMEALKYFYYSLGDKLWGPFGFFDAFSEEYNWYPEKYLAIDQGPIVTMIENYRTGLLWRLFMNDTDVQHGLKSLGFDSPYFDR